MHGCRYLLLKLVENNYKFFLGVTDASNYRSSLSFLIMSFTAFYSLQPTP